MVEQALSIFETDLDKCGANYVPLSPLSFLRRAERVFPEKTAVTHHDRSYNYAQFAQRVRKFASAIRAAGVKPGECVAVLAPNGPVALFQYEASAELSTLTDERRIESRLKAGVIPFDAMESAARAAVGSLPALRAAVREAAQAWAAMGASFDRLAGPDAPPTSRVAGIFEKFEALIARYAPETAAGEEAAPEQAEAQPGAPVAAAAGGPRRMASREDALKQLSEIADFFRRNEPQSPLAYTIDEAIRRGRLTWPELITEIVRDEQTRYNILNSLGIKAE